MAEALRFFFDAGSGVCLWAGNGEARARYDYAVDHHGLALSAPLKERLDELIARFDTDFDWNDPGGARLWSEDARAAFAQDALSALERLRLELPEPGFVIIDESRL